MRLLGIINPDTADDWNGWLGQLCDVSSEIVSGGWAGLELLRASTFDVMVASFPIPEWTPEEILDQTGRITSPPTVVIHNPEARVSDAVRWIRLGAFHVLDDRQPSDELRRLLEFAAASQPSDGKTPDREPWRSLLVGESRPMRDVASIIERIGSRRSTVLIAGETGTGKEIAARAIHMASARAHLPMVAVNCSALPEHLIEAELFGHVKGAFTGAIHQRIGRFEQAHRSTLFLDEIGDMPLELQAKLLRVLQEREFQRIGSSETIRVDVRVIAATNVDLEARVRQGRFREDLFYRLNVVQVTMPPLRDRPDDIPRLVQHFIDKFCRLEDIAFKQATPEALDRLSRYQWPGNVRQLENAVEKAVALSGDRETLYPADFPLPTPQWKPAPAHSATVVVPDNGLDFEQTVGRIERSILEQALRKTGGNKKLAAEMLRLKRTTLSAKLKSLHATVGAA